jgi:hypothetical protein
MGRSPHGEQGRRSVEFPVEPVLGLRGNETEPSFAQERGDDLDQHPEMSRADRVGSALRSAALRTLGNGIGNIIGGTAGGLAGENLGGMLDNWWDGEDTSWGRSGRRSGVEQTVRGLG